MRRRAPVIVAVVGVHVLVWCLWPQQTAPQSGGKRKETALSFVVLAPPASPLPRASSAPPVASRARVVRRTPVAPAITFIAPQQPLDVPLPDPIPEIAPAAPAAADMLARARADVGKIDRDARSRSPDMAQRKIVLHPTMLESGIAGAGKDRGPAPIDEYVLPDGRRMTRVGNICAVKESNGLVGGRDVFRDGVRTRVTSCPK